MLGGFSTDGGKGSVIGATISLVIFGVVKFGLGTLFGFPDSAVNLSVGVILILSVLVPNIVEDIQNIEDAFAHFKPTVNVTFTDAEGGAVEETLKFGELRDFEAGGGKGKLVQNSAFLSGVKEEIDTNAKIRKSIEQNRKLREIFKDAGSREELKEMLQAMLAELEGNK